MTVGSPAAKRIALSCISLEASRFQQITDSLLLSLLGSWTSTALFRRPMMSVFSTIYGLCPSAGVRPGRPVLRPLPRPAAQELVLASLLAPLGVSDLAAPFGRHLFATDASENKGGYVAAKAGVEIQRALWRTASKKGGYSRLLAKEEALLARLSDREPYDLRMLGDVSEAPSLARPLAYHFDVLEVGHCSGQVSSFLSSWGRSVGPVLRASISPAYSLAQDRTVEWVIHLIQHRKVKCLLLAPPCLYSSCRDARGVGLAHFPGGWRSSQPLGAERRLLPAYRCLALLLAASRAGVTALLVQVGPSALCRQPVWRRLALLGVASAESCLCAFGASCCKDCKFLAFGIDLSPLSLPCSPKPRHAAGSLAGSDGSFLPFRLARAIAYEIDRALRRVSAACSLRRLNVEGLECPVVNDVILSSIWFAGDDWCWRATAHINILETASIMRLIKALVPLGPRRVIIFVDSAVAFHACAKGRSASRGLRPVLRKIAALCIGAGSSLLSTLSPPGSTPGTAQQEIYPCLLLPKPRFGLACRTMSFMRPLPRRSFAGGPRIGPASSSFCLVPLLRPAPILGGVASTVPRKALIPLLAFPGRALSSGLFFSGLGSLVSLPARAMFCARATQLTRKDRRPDPSWF